MTPDTALAAQDDISLPAEPEAVGPGRRRQADIYQRGIFGGRPAVPTSWPDLDRFARRRLPRRGYGYIAGGAGSEQTMRADLAAFRRRRLVPRMLRGVGTRNTGIDLFGRRLPAPLLLAPIGALGIVHPQAVSTHGGRQVDGARGSLDSLPEVVEAADGTIPVLMDSGIRGGADIVKAIALGATAVCLGRPYALALGLAGQTGVSEVLANILAELDLTLGLCGYGSLAELGPDALTD